MPLVQILQLIAGITPTVGNIIMMFKNASTQSTTVLISSAEPATQDDINQMQAYLAAHQAATPAATPAAAPASH